MEKTKKVGDDDRDLPKVGRTVRGGKKKKSHRPENPWRDSAEGENSEKITANKGKEYTEVGWGATERAKGRAYTAKREPLSVNIAVIS